MAKGRSAKEKEIGFEEAIASLERIVKELEGADVPLERSLELFEEGVRLSGLCQRKLAEAEKKVQLLTRSGRGFETKPFEDDEPEEGDDDPDAADDDDDDDDEGEAGGDGPQGSLL
jgi:exodeoxyribonuclease VII small subunit